MPVVVITQHVYVATNKEALKIARRARFGNKRSEIISDAEYADRRLKLAETQNLEAWARAHPETSNQGG